MSGQLKAPWADEVVASLNAYQDAGVMHPFTCGRPECSTNLLASRAGWVCPRCGYVQDWCWGWMADWSWKNDPFRQSLEALIKTHEGLFRNLAKE